MYDIFKLLNIPYKQRMNNYIHKLKIGNVELENNLILAPMAGVTNLPFRVVCKDCGAGMVCTEMVSSKAIFYNDKKTRRLLNTKGEKRPISFQAFGSDIESMAYTAKYLSEFADIIDINMGCPAPKIVKNGDGSKILLNLEKAKEIMEVVVKNSTVPVTVKIRKGWNNENIVAVEVAKIAEEVGISAITVHGRTRSEFYTGKADWNIIKKVKENVKIPVIGNGDVVDEESAKKMFDETGVDAIMIGRGSLGNPWIFENIIYYLTNGVKKDPPTNLEKLQVMKKQINLAIEEKGEDIAVKELRKHMAWYTKNMKNSSEFRQKINMITNKDDLINELDNYFL